MSDLDWVIIQLMLLFWGFIGFVLLMVFGPVVLIIHAARKKKPQEENSGPPASEPPAVAVSKEDGRVIAMQAPEVQPVAQVAVTPQKQGLHPLASFALKVLGRVAVGVVMGQINHPHHKK